VTLTVTDNENASSSVAKSIVIKEVIEIKVAILQGVLFTTAANQIKDILINEGDWITDTHHYTFSVDIVTAGDVCGEFGGILRTGSTNNYDLFIIPGIAEPYLFCAPNFDVTNWRSNIRSFVNNGGGYLGICGGAVAASSGLTGGDGITTPMERLIENSTLDLIRAKAVQDFAHPMTATWAGYPSAVGQTAYLLYNVSDNYSRPTGVSIDLHSIDTSHAFFNGFQEPQVAIRWYGGPGFVSEGADILARYPIQEVSANINTRFHVWEYDGPITAPVGITTNYLNPTDDDLNEYVDWLKNNMDFPHIVDYDIVPEEYITTHVSNSGAIVADTYGNGRAIVFGPHPEDWTWNEGYLQENPDTDSNTLKKGLYHWESYTENNAPEWMIFRGAAWAVGIPDDELPPFS